MENKTNEQIITGNIEHMINRTYERITRLVVKYEEYKLIEKLNKEINKVLGAITVVEFTGLQDARNSLNKLHGRLIELRSKELEKIYNK